MFAPEHDVAGDHVYGVVLGLALLGLVFGSVKGRGDELPLLVGTFTIIHSYGVRSETCNGLQSVLMYVRIKLGLVIHATQVPKTGFQAVCLPNSFLTNEKSL